VVDWDRIYSVPEYAYGTEPNDFLASVADQIPAGPVLCLAAGQGRNAVFMARLGHRVVAMDLSRVGLARAQALAASLGVAIETVHADLADFRIEPGAWSGIIAFFSHLPGPLRRQVHRAAAAGLRPGGVFVLEAYTPAHLRYRIGGPDDPELMMTLELLQSDLEGLELVIGRELERVMVEGRLHWGPAAVVQVLARKPG
jgi:SAM-dependent methyltransferase